MQRAGLIEQHPRRLAHHAWEREGRNRARAEAGGVAVRAAESRAFALEHRHLGAAPHEVPCDAQADDAGPDDQNLQPGTAPSAPYSSGRRSRHHGKLVCAWAALSRSTVAMRSSGASLGAAAMTSAPTGSMIMLLPMCLRPFSSPTRFTATTYTPFSYARACSGSSHVLPRSLVSP